MDYVPSCEHRGDKSCFFLAPYLQSLTHAGVAELVDAVDSKSTDRKVVEVQVLFPAHLSMKKQIVIVGQTASGKTDLSLKLASIYHGEIISADSRQVYRGLDIGTAKILPEEMQGIPHHMLDVVDPEHIYSVQDFQKEAKDIRHDIWSREALPFIVGGSMQYVDALVYDLSFPKVPPHTELREELEELSHDELSARLKKSAPHLYEQTDTTNKRRIIRALEINEAGETFKEHTSAFQTPTLFLVIKRDKKELKERISRRNRDRIESGLIEEVADLHKEGLSWERMDALGLEYKYVGRYVRGEISKGELLDLLDTKIGQFAKRQMTWWKKNPHIIWISPDVSEAKKHIDTFLS